MWTNSFDVASAHTPSQVTVEEGNVQTLLPAACLLQLAEIQEACCEFLKRQLDPSNCLGIRAFADTHSCRELLRIADKFTQHNFQEVRTRMELQQVQKWVNGLLSYNISSFFLSSINKLTYEDP